MNAASQLEHLPKVRFHPNLNMRLRHVALIRKSHAYARQLAHRGIASIGRRVDGRSSIGLHGWDGLCVLSVAKQLRQLAHTQTAAVTAGTAQ